MITLLEKKGSLTGTSTVYPRRDPINPSDNYFLPPERSVMCAGFRENARRRKRGGGEGGTGRAGERAIVIICSLSRERSEAGLSLTYRAPGTMVAHPRLQRWTMHFRCAFRARGDTDRLAFQFVTLCYAVISRNARYRCE